MAKKQLKSIFTDDMNLCFFSGSNDIERHHVFEGRQGFKELSEKYGFVVPIDKRLHPNGVHCKDRNWVDRDHWLKRKCQEYFLENIGSREEWLQQFGQFYDDREGEQFDNEALYG